MKKAFIAERLCHAGTSALNLWWHLFIVLFVLTGLCFSAGAESIKNIKLEDYKLSDEATEYALRNDEKHAYCIYADKVNMYILGWSKDGKFAFVEDRAIDGRGGNDLYFNIIDLVTDETVCRKEMIDYYDFDKAGETFIPAYESFEDCLKSNAEEFDRLLKQNGIILKPAKFEKMPVVWVSKDNKTEEVTFKVNKTGEGKPAFIYSETLNYEIVAEKKSGGSKIVKSEKNRESYFVYPVGYIKSPYENRVAVVLTNASFVFEGSELFVEFAGCNLSVGF